jgi:holliday junction DNA helicase RuvA
MITLLRGIILEQDPPNLIIEVNGIGYEVQMPLNNFSSLPQIGKEITLYTHFIVREDGHFLYGFINKEARALFRSLIKINGVGPKMALAILSTMEPKIFAHHVLLNDAASLENIPGVGAKTAKRLLIEMRDKVNEWESNNINTNIEEDDVINDAVSALVALGYKQYEAKKALMKHKNKNLQSTELVKLALKEIN